MAHHLVRQKNGLLAVYSDATRTLIDSDATEEELIETYANAAAEKARKDTRGWIAGKGQHASVGHVLHAMHLGYAEHQLSPAQRAEIQEARRILERLDLPEAVPEKQAEVKNAAEEGARLMQAAVIKMLTVAADVTREGNSIATHMDLVVRCVGHIDPERVVQNARGEQP